MPTFRQYPSTNYITNTDVVLINRLGVGTLEILADLLIQNSVTYTGYDISMGFFGTPPANSTIFAFNAVRNYELPVNLTNSAFSWQQAPSGSVTLTVNKNSGAIGSIAFNNSTVGNATFTSNVSFAAGDELQVVTPSNLYNANTLAMTFSGVRI
jgi:hypothetical protein